MARRKQVAVIGLGRFGASMCYTLMRQDVEVLAVDSDERRVAELSTLATHVVQADSTDDRVLSELDIASFDSVVIAIGEDVQASILTALMVKQLGVKDIWAKAKSDYHAKVLELIGVDHVVHPERDMGTRIARLLATDSLLDFIELGDEHQLVELRAPESMIGHTLRDLDLRAQTGCIVIGTKHDDHTTLAPDAEMLIERDDILLVIGGADDLRKLSERSSR